MRKTFKEESVNRFHPFATSTDGPNLSHLALYGFKCINVIIAAGASFLAGAEIAGQRLGLKPGEPTRLMISKAREGIERLIHKNDNFPKR